MNSFLLAALLPVAAQQPPPISPGAGLAVSILAVLLAIVAVFMLLAAIFWVYSGLGLAELMLIIGSFLVATIGGFVGSGSLIYAIRYLRHRGEKQTRTGRKQAIATLILSILAVLPGIAGLGMIVILLLTA